MERVVDGAPAAGRMRLHPVVFANTAGFAAFVGLVVTLLIRHNDLPAPTEWQIVAWGVVVALSGVVVPVLRWRGTWIALGERRLAWSGGLLRRRTLDAELADLRSLQVVQSWIGPWLGYGELHVVDGTGVEHVFGPVGRLDLFRAAASRCGRRRGRRDG